MRTTLVIPDAVYERAKQAAGERGCTLSELFTESVELHLAAMCDRVAEKRPAYCVNQIPMGKPTVDVNDRDALYRAMEE